MHEGIKLDVRECNQLAFLLSNTASWNTVCLSVNQKKAVTQEVLMTNYTANLNHNEPIYLYMYLVALVDFRSGP